jgi:heme-degrading monooxygenase HmoA
MVAIIFEVTPTDEGQPQYLSISTKLKESLINMPGFISVEHFQSLTDSDKQLTLSFWEDEESVSKWRNLVAHRNAQPNGRDNLLHDYRIRVGNIVRDYSLYDRHQAP